MIRAYRIIRALIIAAILLGVVVPMGLYMALSAPWAQERLRHAAEVELTRLLGTEVSVGAVHFEPFNTISVENVSVEDDFGKKALEINDIDARFELSYFLSTGRIAVDYAAIDGLKARIYKATDKSPLNIAGIIKRLKPKQKQKPASRIQLSIGSVDIRHGDLRYDVLNAPQTPDRFNAKHVRLNGVELAAMLPTVGNDSVAVRLDRLTATEASGLKLNNLTATVYYTPKSLEIQRLGVALPNTNIRLGNIKLRYDSIAQLREIGRSIPVKLKLLDGSHITPSDISPLIPSLKTMNDDYDLSIEGYGTLKDLTIRTLKMSHPGLALSMQGQFSIDSLSCKDLHLLGNIRAAEVAAILAKANSGISPKMLADITRLGNVRIDVNASGDRHNFDGNAMLRTSGGDVAVDGTLSSADNSFDHLTANATVDIRGINLGLVAADARLGRFTGSIDVDAEIIRSKRNFAGEVCAQIDAVEWNGKTYRDIVVRGNSDFDRTFVADLAANTEAGNFVANVGGSYEASAPALNLAATIQNADLQTLGVSGKYDGYKLNAEIGADLQGRLDTWVNGYVQVKKLRFEHPEKPSIEVDNIRLSADNTSSPGTMSIESDFLNGHLSGEIHPQTIVGECRDILSHIIPAFVDVTWHEKAQKDVASGRSNKFTYEFELADAEKLSRFLRLPVQVIYPVTIDGEVDYANHRMTMAMDAPYLLNGEKLVENTAMQIDVSGEAADGGEGLATIYATTQMPTKKGEMAVVANLSAAAGRIDTRIDWSLEREKPINGQIAFSTLLDRDARGLCATVDFNPCNITFGDDIWNIARSTITYNADGVRADGFRMSTDTQSISIDGTASADIEDVMNVKLDHIEMIKIFETLDINKALIGGIATGTIQARGLMGPNRAITADHLHVKDISYNYCTLGDANVKALWDADRMAVALDADIVDENGIHSHIGGDIFPMNEGLDIIIDATKVKVGFLKPFMAAFADDVSGYASGHARLFGTFKFIDLEGDLYADNFGIKIGFTNTWYYATDSVHIRPGIIEILPIKIKDSYGNTADLRGWVKHTYFKAPEFDFAVTNAHNFLSYDVTPSISPDWYGRIYGNGSAFVTGRPGMVNIGVNMSTAPGSTFTFVLSDRLDAEEYKFLTFRRKQVKSENGAAVNPVEVDPVPAVIREYQRRMRKANEDNPSTYSMDIQVDITPQAKVNLVMDPVGGDEIKSNGSGNLRMTYVTPGNDLHLYGTYTIEHGTYNFTLQDIIVKDFTIKEGSSVAFTGDPYNARLDINATYGVNANLSDLDESFLQDKDLNRTNVPVNAVMKVSGDMRQPDIAFDLEFPTLTSDVYRKVRSIVSTDEMMNRQIIYLLALNRFYTPEYMSTTKGSDLFSVASSTISSQLSSMLGKLSDNWTIAPNLRSDRGDFSDVEFDVALSSTLLNNRLRLNGNFGYRDKSLNTNQFIGDFDIEYLLTPSGVWRLKAYNRYNDQNYYLRTAQTTQGVGIMYRRDFDRMFNFLRRRPKQQQPTDSINATHSEPAASNRPDTVPTK